MTLNRLSMGTKTHQRIQQREIAARAGVSISTVSRVLNGVTGISETLQQRVLSAAAELGYQGIADTIQRKVQSVTLLTDLPLEPLLDPFHADILSGVEAECRRQGIHMSYAATSAGSTSSTFVLERIKQNRVGGIILLSVDDSLLIEQCIALGVPIVLINAEHPGLPIDTFLPDNQFGPLLAMRHLIEQGHRRILHLTHIVRRTIQRRHEAYRAALEEAGIPYDPALVVDTNISAEGGYEVTKRILAENKLDFTAIFCANDITAIGVLRAMQEAGRSVPEDVSVVGYDDIAMAAFLSPPLTTVRIEREELGSLAVRRLIERATSPILTPIRVELAARLVKRQSVGRVNSKPSDGR